MKKKALLMTCALALVAFAVEETVNSGNEAKVTVRVVDEEGKPVENATVSGGFEKAGDKAGHMRATTGTDGVFVAKANIDSYYAWGRFVAEKNGYYMFDHEPYRGGSPKDGKWQPYNPTQTLVLKKIIKPIPMYAKGVLIECHDLPKDICYDLQVGDWVAPEGKGRVSDFIFALKSVKPNVTDHVSNLKVTFTNPGDGVIPVEIPDFKEGKGSQLRMPHTAPTSGYLQQVYLEDIRIVNENKFKRDPKEGMNYFFRVRTVQVKDGKIISANYGKIHGDFWLSPGRDFCAIQFKYYLNPTPNERNVEFDPKQNLFKDLQSFDQVVDP